jgi:hypothetical protein
MIMTKAIKRAIAGAPNESFLRVATFETMGSRPAIETALGRACRHGELERIEKGLYWKGAPSRFGATKPNWLTLALELSSHRAGGPSGATAAYVLSASTQIPSRAEIAIVGTKPSGRASAGINYVMRSNPIRAELTHEEIALLELARERFRRVEINEASFAERLSQLIASNRVDPKRVKRAATNEPRVVRDSLRRLSNSIFSAAA